MKVAARYSNFQVQVPILLFGKRVKDYDLHDQAKFEDIDNKSLSGQVEEHFMIFMISKWGPSGQILNITGDV